MFKMTGHYLPTDNLPIIRQPANEAWIMGTVSMSSDSKTLKFFQFKPRRT